MIVVNFKTYGQGTGEEAIKLIEIMSKVQEKTGVKLIAAVQAIDLRILSKQNTVEVWAQHIDTVTSGAHTGNITSVGIKDAGAKGSLLNHPEKSVQPKFIDNLIRMLDIVDLQSLVIVEHLSLLKKIKTYNPTYIALEKSDVIGSDRAVCEEYPDLIKQAVKVFDDLLIGGGITSKEDVLKSRELGAKGVLLASAVVKSEDPEKILVELSEGFKT